MTLVPNSMQARDIEHLVHPATNMKRHEEQGPLIIVRGEGVSVYDEEGKRYLEGMAGLWSVAVGFNEQRLINAAARQMAQLPYYHIFSHKSNNPAIDLADKLVGMTPRPLQKVFFTNSGSEANDTVIKIIWYYNNALGRFKKKKLISRNRAYHGITVASGSLTGLGSNHSDFDLPLPGFLHVSCPSFYHYAEEGETPDEFATRLARELEETILREGPETVAAFFGEPVMGGGGVIVPPETYWKKLVEVCRRYDVLVVADEVINGFGRLGKPFGCEVFGFEPDFMVLSKQLTSSYQPLAAVMMTNTIYDAISQNSAKIGTFGHGFTASGHPVACAVALENISIIEERNLFSRARDRGELMQSMLRELTDHPLIGEVRGLGLIAGIELVEEKGKKEPPRNSGKLGAYLYNRAQQNGLIVRAIENTIALCPPLIISEEELTELVKIVKQSLDETLAWHRAS